MSKTRKLAYTSHSKRDICQQVLMDENFIKKKGAFDFFLQQMGEDPEVFATAVTEAIIKTDGSEYLKQEQNETLIQLSAQMRNELRNKFRDMSAKEAKEALGFYYGAFVEDSTNEIYKSLLEVSRKGTHMALSNAIVLKSLVTDLFPVLNSMHGVPRSEFNGSLSCDKELKRLHTDQCYKQNSDLNFYELLYVFVFKFLTRFTHELTAEALTILNKNIDNPNLAKTATEKPVDENLINMLHNNQNK